MTVAHDDLLLPRSRPYTAKKEESRSCLYCSDDIVVLYLFLCIAALYSFCLFGSLVLANTPYAEIPSMKIDSITISNFNLSNPIYARWNINMTMSSSESSFEFSDNAVSVFHRSKEEALWMTRLQGFDMRPKNTSIHFALDFGGLVDVNDTKVHDTIVRAIEDSLTNNHGAVEFNVQLRADHLRGRSISPLKQFLLSGESKLNKLIISCDVLLLFESSDKTRAYMLMTNNLSCVFVYPSCLPSMYVSKNKLPRCETENSFRYQILHM